RDFKSQNVLLVPAEDGERAVVTDFGLARSMAAPSAMDPTLTVAGEMIGTPGTMAPEQIDGKVATPASDVYGLGAVLYEMIAGHGRVDAAPPPGGPSGRAAALAPLGGAAGVQEPLGPQPVRLALDRALGDAGNGAEPGAAPASDQRRGRGPDEARAAAARDRQ